jgi:hypothetical protein
VLSQPIFRCVSYIFVVFPPLESLTLTGYLERRIEPKMG